MLFDAVSRGEEKMGLPIRRDILSEDLWEVAIG